MPNRTGLSTSLNERVDIFGEFHQSFAFRSTIKRRASDCSNLGASQPYLPGNRVLNSENDVFTYLDDVTESKPDVSILAFVNPAPEKNGELPLPISGKLYECVVQTFRLPPTFLTTFSTGLATYTSTVLPTRPDDKKQWEHAQFAIQQNRAYSAVSMALSFDIRTGSTRALLFGVETKILSRLFERLSSISALPYGPMVIPAIAMELHAEWFCTTIKTCHDRIYSIETATGMRQYNHSHEINGANCQHWKNVDLIGITRDLSSFLARFAFFRLQAETGVYLLQQMTQATELLIKTLDKNGAKDYINDPHSILLKLRDLESCYLGIAARCRYLTERTAAQTQTIYCLIASRDNLTNVEIARASRNIAEESHKENEAMRIIAELSRRDNELMIQVAKDSRTVAVAAARDSASMQAIAAVTVLFLPATFVATFFSMSFFDFLDASGPRISPWGWMYAVITMALTAIIQLTWAAMSNRKKARLNQMSD